MDDPSCLRGIALRSLLDGVAGKGGALDSPGKVAWKMGASQAGACHVTGRVRTPQRAEGCPCTGDGLTNSRYGVRPFRHSFTWLLKLSDAAPLSADRATCQAPSVHTQQPGFQKPAACAQTRSLGLPPLPPSCNCAEASAT